MENISASFKKNKDDTERKTKERSKKMKKDFSKLMKEYEEKFISAYSNREEKRNTKHQTPYNLGSRVIKLDD